MSFCLHIALKKEKNWSMSEMWENNHHYDKQRAFPDTPLGDGWQNKHTLISPASSQRPRTLWERKPLNVGSCRAESTLHLRHTPVVCACNLCWHHFLTPPLICIGSCDQGTPPFLPPGEQLTHYTQESSTRVKVIYWNQMNRLMAKTPTVFKTFQTQPGSVRADYYLLHTTG